MSSSVFGCPMLSTSLLAAFVTQASAAGFFEESSASLTSRNFYLDRDYKGETPYAAAREWAQGFILKFGTGYTEGQIGFGLDATGLLGIKLDSSPNRTNTQLIRFNPVTREVADEYSELGLTLKTKVSKTKLSVGTQFPALPVITASPARLLPQSFRGAYVQSDEVDKLTLHAGRMDRVNLRDSSDYQDISVASPNGRFRGAATSDKFDFFGGDYKLAENITLRAFHSVLENIYRQDFLGGLSLMPIGTGKIRSDIRIFRSSEDGEAKAGRVDNLNVGGMLSYIWGGHTFGVGYLQQSGDTAFPYIVGGEPAVLTDGTMSADFVNPKERTWAVRYDYNFVAMGLPGLTAMARYLRGDNIDLPALGGSNLKESSKDFELQYVVQSGPVKGLVLRLREAFYRNQQGAASSFRSDNETRINIDYTIKFW